LTNDISDREEEEEESEGRKRSQVGAEGGKKRGMR
jgi:hypothetical protein